MKSSCYGFRERSSLRMSLCTAGLLHRIASQIDVVSHDGVLHQQFLEGIEAVGLDEKAIQRV
jgi:hypothetical protein